ncbi:MAG: sugar-phosphatase [Chlamydiales bacterium]
MNVQGIIALDIDGTTAPMGEKISKSVSEYLDRVHEEGWKIIFITGRSFSMTQETLQLLSFDYYLALNNGAIILHMPTGEILFQHYLDSSCLEEIHSIASHHNLGFVIYAGYGEHRDVCFYDPNLFQEPMRDYLQERRRMFTETWRPVDNILKVPITSFASIKFFGRGSKMHQLAEDLEKKLDFHAPVNKDPFNEDYFVVQVTAQTVNKGKALFELKQSLGHEHLPVIAVGDDRNDIEMLREATHKVAIKGAPEELIAIADYLIDRRDDQAFINQLNQILKQQNG